MQNKQFDLDLAEQDTVVVTVPADKEVHTKLSTFVPIIVTLIGFLNTLGVSSGWWSALPFTTEEVTVALSGLVTVVGTIYSWWKDNDVTKTALKRTEVAKQAVPKK